MLLLPSGVKMAVMEGPLSKWTNVMKGWQYRWFVLDDGAGLLSYYTVSGGRHSLGEGITHTNNLFCMTRVSGRHLNFPVKIFDGDLLAAGRTF